MVPANIPGKWDYEADVVVIGGGTAGLPAAIITAEAKLKTVVLETRNVCGGSFRMIIGSVAIPGSDEQKALGIDDSTDIFCQDLVNRCGAEPALARAVADNQPDCYRLFKERGFKFPGLYALPGHSRLRALGYIGKQGPALVQTLEESARSKGVEILFKHRANRLINNPATGRVIGVEVKVDEATKNFKARKAVIIATGGFGHNREMIAEYAPHMLNAIPKMPTSHQGDGLKMALDLGAATKDIAVAVAPSWPVCMETHNQCLRALNFGGLMVNIHGKRFHDESSSENYYAYMTGEAMRQPQGFYWVILNDAVKDNIRKITVDDLLASIERCRQIKADSLDELAKLTNLDAKALKETFDKYNKDIETVGYDTVFGRKFQFGLDRPLFKLDTPKYYAIKCVTAITSMKGGIKINSSTQVINNYGDVIPGLYAAGEVIGGLFTKSYILGTMTSGAMALGIIAGKNAIKEPSVS